MGTCGTKPSKSPAAVANASGTGSNKPNTNNQFNMNMPGPHGTGSDMHLISSPRNRTVSASTEVSNKSSTPPHSHESSTMINGLASSTAAGTAASKSVVNPMDFAILVEERMCEIINDNLLPTDVQHIQRNLRALAHKGKDIDEETFVKLFLGEKEDPRISKARVVNLFAYGTLFGDDVIQYEKERLCRESKNEKKLDSTTNPSISLSSSIDANAITSSSSSLFQPPPINKTITPFIYTFLVALGRGQQRISSLQKYFIVYHALIPAHHLISRYSSSRYITVPTDVLENKNATDRFHLKLNVPRLPPTLAEEITGISEYVSFKDFYRQVKLKVVDNFLMDMFRHVLPSPDEERLSYEEPYKPNDSATSISSYNDFYHEYYSYLIDAEWHTQWTQYTTPSPTVPTHERPRDIPNHRVDVKNAKSYNVITKRQWDVLQTLYGGGPPLPIPSIPHPCVTPLIVYAQLCDPRQPYRRGPCTSTYSFKFLLHRDAKLYDVWPLFTPLLQGAGVEPTPNFAIRMRLWAHQGSKFYLLLPGHTTWNDFESYRTYSGESTIGMLLNDSESDEDHNFKKIMLEYTTVKLTSKSKKSQQLKWPRTAEYRHSLTNFQADHQSWFTKLSNIIHNNFSVDDYATDLQTGTIVSNNGNLTSNLSEGIHLDVIDHTGKWHRCHVRATAIRVVYDHSAEDDNVDDDDMTEVCNLFLQIEWGDVSQVEEEWMALVVDEQQRSVNAKDVEELLDIDKKQHWQYTHRIAPLGKYAPDLTQHDNQDSNAIVTSTSTPTHTSNMSKTVVNYNICPYPLLGATGLDNLGNTCYLNSALQCVCYIPLLRSYFISQLFKKDLNPENPLGTEGASVTVAFGDLLKDIAWSAKYKHKAPSAFRKALGKTFLQFSSNEQQDAQELLSYLMDSLHEDVNTVTSKPYVPNLSDQEMISTPLLILGRKLWHMFLRRNKSIIADIAMGQFISNIKCESCGHVSYNFDPYTTVSVPIKDRGVAVQMTLLRRFNPNKPCKLERKYLNINRHSNMADLKQLVFSNLPVTEGPSNVMYKVCLLDMSPSINNDSNDNSQLLSLPLYWHANMIDENATIGYGVTTLDIIVYENTLTWSDHYDAKSDTIEHEEDEDVRATTLNDLARKMSKNSWPKDEHAFHNRNLTGLRCDAMDHRKEWFSGTITHHNRTDSNVTIHYDLFSYKWDEQFSYEDFQDKITPLYTHVKPRDRLTELHVKHVLHKTMFGVSFFVNLQTEWNCARAGAHILQQASRFLFAKHNEGVEVMRRYKQHALTKLEECVAYIKVMDDRVRNLRLEKGGVGVQEVEAMFSEKVNGMLHSLPFEVWVVGAEIPPFIQHSSNDDRKTGKNKNNSATMEHAFPFSLLVTLGNYFSPKMHIQLHWKALDVNSVGKLRNSLQNNSSRANTSDREDDDNEFTTNNHIVTLYTKPEIVAAFNPSSPLSSSDKDKGRQQSFRSQYTKAQEYYNSMTSSINSKSSNKNNTTLSSNNVSAKISNKSSIVQIGDCFNEFCKEEMINGQWKCPKCNQIRDGRQSLRVWRLPDILTIHIKRFNASARYREKITSKVDFPLMGLNMSQWLHPQSPQHPNKKGDGESNLYDLFGVVNHVGSLSGGHYMATCKATPCSVNGYEEAAYSFNGSWSLDMMKNSIDDSNGNVGGLASSTSEKISSFRLRSKSTNAQMADRQQKAQLATRTVLENPQSPLWLQFDDDIVEPMPEGNVCTEAAYVLFYRKRMLSSSNIAKYSSCSTD